MTDSPQPPSADSRDTLGYAPAGARQPPRAAAPMSWLALLMIATIGPLIVISQVVAHLRLDVVDDQMFGYYGWRIAHGATVYLDVWDNKPPGIYWINALGFLLGGDSYAGVIALCAAAVVAAHVCFFGIAASWYFRESAALATILASFFLTHGYYQGGTNRTETFLVAFELAAVLCYVRGWSRDRWWLWLLAGAFAGTAFLFKQVGLAAWGAMGLQTLLLMLTRELRWRSGLIRGLLLVVGAALPVGAAVGCLAWQGALDAALFATFGFNRAYFEAGVSEFPYSFVSFFLLRYHLMPIMRLPLLMAVAAVIHAALWSLRPALRPVEIQQKLAQRSPACPRPVLLCVIWLLAATYGALLSPHGFRHYLVPTIPPLMLICAYLVNVLQAEMSLLRRLQQRAWVTAAFVAMGWFALDAGKFQLEEVSKVWLDRIERGRKADWELVGDELARQTTPDQKIQAWAYWPGAYLHARRVNVCRFTTTEKVGQLERKPEQAAFIRRELQERLTADPPAAFAIAASDWHWVNFPEKHDKPVDELGRWLATWLRENYVAVGDVVQANVYVFKRKDLVSPDTPRPTLPQE